MQNISGFGLNVSIIASNTFPVGLLLNQFSDDSDAMDIENLQISDKSMGLNGDLITWSKANPIIVSLSVIPGSFTDINLGILLEANRVGQGKIGARDIINMTAVYPNEIPIIFTNGVITDGIPGIPIASSGRFKTRTYKFSFENKVGGV